MLTSEQLKQRAGKLTASRIACLMNGDAKAIYQLYLELTDQAEPEDLSRVWAVQLGAATEELNLHWYEMNGNPLSRRGEVVIHPHWPWAACTLDAWDDVLECPVEAKHVGGREPLEVVIERYQPQMQWQMDCTGADQCALSVIMGVNPPIIEYIQYDPEYAAEMNLRGKQFMECVRARRPPVALDAVPAPADATKVVDMTGNNQWADSAAEWIATRVFADRCKDAEKVLKSIVPADAKKCHGHDVQITRDRAGRLSLREIKQ
jgi:predicted phage-related endonuclease